tara:strand:- start:912 stop:1505 length:594 start_codon:yes stop_codon:yes gene_type:complete
MDKTLALMTGASNHTNEEREQNDYYATEPLALEKFLDTIDFSLHKFIWEPACGGGHLVDVLLKRNHVVFATDIINRNDKAMMIGDFLETDIKSEWTGDILTNPPFRQAEKFVHKGLSLLEPGNFLILFQRILFLESSKRHRLFKAHPPKYVYVHSSRVATAKNGDFEKYEGGGKSMCYCWFVWQKGCKDETIVRWIP